MEKKQVIILCGKSACGKDYISKYMIKKYGYTPIISTTTRPIRENEENGIDYNFVTKEFFQKMIQDDKLIEYRTYNTLFDGKEDTWYYGLHKQRLEESKKYVVILDLNGARSFIKYYGKENCEVVFIDCPSEIRTKRAMKRGSFSEQEWERRLETDLEDFNYKNRLGIVDRIVDNWNRNVDDVVKEIIYG